MAQTHEFKAEIKQVLDLVIHSLYSKKEIFLRELISNASDAIDRAQYLGLTEADVVADNPQWQITLIADKTARTLTIADNGIGMTPEELEESLGTIAKSGTKAFVEALKGKDGANIPELIGQFGVGFYAAFMVADSVTVETLRRGTGQKAVRWFSTGDGSYTIDDSTQTVPGTTITLHLREGMENFAETWTIKDLVKRYSDFIAYPIRLGEEGKPPADDADPINTMRAIWKRSKSEITPEEYNTFYKHIAHEAKDPLKVIHISAEGVLEYKAILFIPQDGGLDLMMPDQKRGINLYVRNVFIGNDFEELMPPYLRFIKGVVDSSDLPLNVSREMLQDDLVLRKIKTDLTNRVLKTLAEMAKDKPEEYATFYRALGTVLKEGLHSDWENKDKLKELIRYPSIKNADDAMVTLKEYREAMSEDQKAIYYLVADSLQTARHSPYLEALKKRGFDVLLMTDPIDEWIADTLGEYDKLPIQSIATPDLDLGEGEGEKEAEKKELDEATETFKPLMEALQKKLEGDIAEVRVSSRLVDSPCVLVAAKDALPPAMQRMMQAMGQSVPKQKRVLELNAKHPLLEKMNTMFSANADDPVLTDYIDLLYGQALIAEGSELPDPGRFVKLVSALMAQ